MNNRVSVRVPTNDTRFYDFNVNSFGHLTIETGNTLREDGQTAEYASFIPGTNKGAQALVYLVEDVARYRAFFEAVRKISVTNAETDVFDGFIDEAILDEGEQEEAWELIGEMIEEANRADPDR